MLDWRLFGNHPAGHHLASLLLHIGTSTLLFLFFHKTTGNIWPAAFTAAFFALHPLRVESVAWASERKDVLSLFFGIACIYAYAFYAEKPRIAPYVFCLTLFILSVMSKSMLVTLPFILLLLDYWPLRRWQKISGDQKTGMNQTIKLIGEKVPFLIKTIIISISAIWSQNKAGSVASIIILPFSVRCINAVIAYATYLEKILWPSHLVPIYHDWMSLSFEKVFISIIALIFVSILVIYYQKKWPFLPVGWFWYLGTLIPVIGLIQVGTQAMADRYTYLPSIGITIMIAWGMPSLINIKFRGRKILFSVGLEEYQLAIDDFNKTIALTPAYFEAYNNRGFIHLRLGQYQQAVDNYSQAMLIKPDYADAWNNRAFVYLTTGNAKSGCYDAKKACAIGECATLKMAWLQGHCH